MDENGNDLTFDITFGSILGTPKHCVPAPLSASTPRARTASKKNLFKVPGLPPRQNKNKTVQKVLKGRQKALKKKQKCKVCAKEYVNPSSLKNHMRGHAIEAAAERIPDRDNIMMNLPEIVEATLHKICNTTIPCAVTEYTLDFLKMTRKRGSFEEFAITICERFLSAIYFKKFLLPSKLLEALVKECDALLSDYSFRSEMVCLLSLARSECDDDILQLFICKYVLASAQELLKFISASVCIKFPMRKTYECDKDERQSIHFIGGALMRGFFKAAKRYPSSNLWKSIKDTVVRRLLENETNQDKSWTTERNRGNLLNISDDCLEFLVVLAEIIESNLEPDGSIVYLNVYEKVCKSMAMTVYWDGMISDSLSESVSLAFMKAVIKSFCQTYGRGVSKKKMNTLHDVPIASITLRHAVVRKVHIK